MIIKAQGKLIEALQQDNENMAGMLDRFHCVMLEAKLKNLNIDVRSINKHEEMDFRTNKKHDSPVATIGVLSHNYSKWVKEALDSL
jgi:hypothetical protein